MRRKGDKSIAWASVEYLVVGLVFVIGFAPHADISLLVVEALEFFLLLPSQIDVEVETRQDFLPHIAMPDVVHNIRSRDVNRDVCMPALLYFHVSHSQHRNKWT